jgi:hypothetical protein
MSEAALTKEIANMLRGLSPQEAKALLKNLRAEAIASAAVGKKQEAEQAELYKAELGMRKKKQKAYFQKYDSELKEIPAAYQKIRDELAEVTGWQPGMGDCELHFKDKPLGGQCLWACKWYTGSRGVISPDSYYPIDRMTAVELMSEARDLVNMRQNFEGVRHPDIALVEKEVLPFIKVFDDGGIPKLETLREKIRRFRGSYTEFIAPWDIPADSFMVLARPGWGSRTEILEAMEKLRSNRVPRR